MHFVGILGWICPYDVFGGVLRAASLYFDADSYWVRRRLLALVKYGSSR